MKKQRTALLSLAGLLLCVCLILGGTYALYSDRASVRNHLQSGTLDLTLTRTHLEYTLLDETTGYLRRVSDDGPKAFTDSTTESIFGFAEGEAMQVVPGSYFEAALRIGRAEGAYVAFDSFVEIQLLQPSDVALADQLLVTLTASDGSLLIDGVCLRDLVGRKIHVGRVSPQHEEQNLTVRVEFADKASNNEAQGQKVLFDLVVSAVQATEE